MTNPLHKYFRQPKVYLSLPSKGKYYPPGLINGDPNSLPVFGMTAMDEIMLKTPDALFSGEAVVSIIKSCIPGITNPWLMPQIDLDSVLVAIRLATYGQKLNTLFTCSACNESNDFDLDLAGVLDYFTNLTYDDTVLVGPLMFHLRPLTYKQVTHLSMKGYNFRRQLVSGVDTDIPEDEKAQLVDQAYKSLASLTMEAFQLSIESVEAEDEVVTDANDIIDWIQNADTEFYADVKTHLDLTNSRWSIQPQKVNCAHCDAENTVSIRLDNADFFAKRS